MVHRFHAEFTVFLQGPGAVNKVSQLSEAEQVFDCIPHNEIPDDNQIHCKDGSGDLVDMSSFHRGLEHQSWVPGIKVYLNLQQLRGTDRQLEAKSAIRSGNV